MNIPQFAYVFSDGHLGCFQYVIINKTVINFLFWCGEQMQSLVSCMLGKSSTTEAYRQPVNILIHLFGTGVLIPKAVYIC
jgi:hypothetical protein